MTDAVKPETPSIKDATVGRDEMRPGTVAKLNLSSGFGYVADDDGIHSYIFVAGHALPRSSCARLQVGSRVQFRTSGQGRVDQLVKVGG